LAGQYWDDPDHNLWAGLDNPPPGPFFTDRKFERDDAVIDFQWGLGEAPDERLTPQYWSARWTGKLLVPQTDDYTFYLDHLDDAGRLWIDGQLLIDSWLVQAPQSHPSPPMRLEAGLHDIKIEYHQAMALAGSIQVAWEAPSLPKEVIPACFGGM
jgi:mannan endo-1,4-beta-mannosidase